MIFFLFAAVLYSAVFGVTQPVIAQHLDHPAIGNQAVDMILLVNSLIAGRAVRRRQDTNFFVVTDRLNLHIEVLNLMTEGDQLSHDAGTLYEGRTATATPSTSPMLRNLPV